MRGSTMRGSTMRGPNMMESTMGGGGVNYENSTMEGQLWGSVMDGG